MNSKNRKNVLVEKRQPWVVPNFMWGFALVFMIPVQWQGSSIGNVKISDINIHHGLLC